MKKLIVAATALFGLTACGGSDGNFNDSYAPESRSAKVAYEQDMAAAPEPVPSRPGEASGGNIPQSGPMLAYTHNRTIETPPKALASVVSTHQVACEQAGPQSCMVVNSSQSGLGEDWAHANLHIRATPAWIETFLGGLSANLEDTKSRIRSASTYAEDLSTQIIDTDARLKAKLTLRDRLQGLLTDRPSELGDLLDLERELARVQADIDSSASLLEALKQRVAMSNLHLNYQARQSAASQSVWQPLGDAFNSFFGHFAGALAAIVTTIAIVLPWIPVVIGLIWVARFIWRRVFRKGKPKPTV